MLKVDNILPVRRSPFSLNSDWLVLKAEANGMSRR